jgi:3-hydroxy-9,10-secoandrosta-1,3,5(10)-triene-9,17-dione monooxygenase reductase component
MDDREMSDPTPREDARPDAAPIWPPPSLVDQFLGDLDFEFRLGEDLHLPGDDPGALADARRFRDVLGRFASGVTVVTSMSGDTPVGMTCQSFCSVSLSPPLVLFCPAKTSRAWPLMRAAGHFCVNLLAADQSKVSDAFATRGEDKYDGVGWSRSKTGAPLLDGVVGYVDCTVEQVHEAGDHYVVIGRVQDLGFGEGGPEAAAPPLTFYRGTYGTHREA